MSQHPSCPSVCQAVPHRCALPSVGQLAAVGLHRAGTGSSKAPMACTGLDSPAECTVERTLAPWHCRHLPFPLHPLGWLRPGLRLGREELERTEPAPSACGAAPSATAAGGPWAAPSVLPALGFGGLLLLLAPVAAWHQTGESCSWVLRGLGFCSPGWDWSQLCRFLPRPCSGFAPSLLLSLKSLS